MSHFWFNMDKKVANASTIAVSYERNIKLRENLYKKIQ
jgi:hypothetical protein